DVELQKGRRMIGRPPRRRRFDPVKAQLSNIQCIDEGIDHANRIALVNPVIEAFRQQRRLRPIRPCNEALHQFPRRIIRRILAAPAFSHSQGQSLTRGDLPSSIVFWSAAPSTTDATCCIAEDARLVPARDLSTCNKVWVYSITSSAAL